MKILIITQYQSWAQGLIKSLKDHQAKTDLTTNGKIGLNLAQENGYDCVIVGASVPEVNGVEICRILRSKGRNYPILLILDQDQKFGQTNQPRDRTGWDRLAMDGFEAGMDDFITWEDTPEKILSQIRTLWRHKGRTITPIASPNSAMILNWGPLAMDLEFGEVTLSNEPIALTPTEYNLLELFLRNPHRLFSRNAILDSLWGLADSPTDRAIITYIKDLRKKLKAAGLNHDPIATVYGMGYRLKPFPQTDSSSSFTPPPNSPELPMNSPEKMADIHNIWQEQILSLEELKITWTQNFCSPGLRLIAHQEVYKLAGSLGSFGYEEGSKIARSLENLLKGVAPLTQADRYQYYKEINMLINLLKYPPPYLNSIVQPSAQQKLYPNSHDSLVLVVDDDLALVKGLSEVAIHWGWRVETLTNLIAAQLWLESLVSLGDPMLPQVILLDLSFVPNQEDGLEFLVSLKSNYNGKILALAEVPVVIFTAHDDLYDRLEVSRLGAKQFLLKPASFTEIFETLNRVQKNQQLTLSNPKIKILVLDDDSTILSLVQELLTPWGCVVTTLKDSENFWTVLTEIQPDLIILDLEVRPMNGLDLCQVVRGDARWGDLPVLVMTGHQDPNWLCQAFEAGADDFITKSILEPELVTRVLSRIKRSSW